MSLRHIYGIEWKDNLAWMEYMSGPRWEALVKQEETLISKIKEEQDGQEDLTLEIFQDFQKAQAPPYRDGKIIVRPFLRDFLWRWVSSMKCVHAVSLYTSGEYVWYIEDTSEGAEEYTLFCMKEGHTTPVWKKKGVSPHFVVLGKRCFFIEAKNRLVYWKLISCDAAYGTSMDIIYEELNMSYNLQIISSSTSCAYMTSSSGPFCNLFEITEHTFHRLHTHSKESTRYIIDTQKGHYLTWSQGEWKPSTPLLQWKLPLCEVPEWIDTEKKLIVTKWFARRTLWQISTTHRPHPLWKGVGQIILNKYHIGLIQPGNLNKWIPLTKLYQLGNTSPVYPTMKTVASASPDKKPVPFIIIEPHKRYEDKLLVIGYGAYGNATSMDTTRWESLLKRGWYICIGCWRGGGDHTPEWEDAGRLSGRENVLLDAYAVIKEAQRLTDCKPEHTVLYGRSAGGLWVGGLSARYPDGSLAKGAYMEVPYLDVLRTTTNDTLPLTCVELNEFGMPLERLSDFLSVTQWSPMETMSVDGITGMFQIIRTASNDSQVFPYESFKWVVRARAGTKPGIRPIYIMYSKGQGHFIRESSTLFDAYSEDLSLLFNLIAV